MLDRCVVCVKKYLNLRQANTTMLCLTCSIQEAVSKGPLSPTEIAASTGEPVEDVRRECLNMANNKLLILTEELKYKQL